MPRAKSIEIPLLLGAILYILCLQVFFLVNFNINWDEFHFLSFIFDHSRGTLSIASQTFHVHLLSWITHLGWDEIQLILLSRTLMLCCELLTLYFIYLISRKFVSVRFSLIGVVSYLASGYVLMYGASFRYDPIITALLMASIYLLMDRSKFLWRGLAASVAIALAILISIKSVLFVPPLIAALVWRTRDMEGMKNRIGTFIGFALSVSITTLIFYFWHRSTLAPAATGTASATGALPWLWSIFSKVLVDVPFWPQKYYFLSWITASWSQMLLIFAGLILIVMRHTGKFSALLIVTVLFTLPIISIFFYRNAYPYFFPFIVAPSMIAVSIGAHQVSENVSGLFTKFLVIALLIYMVTFTSGQAYLYSYHHQTGQKEVISTIHRMFPQTTAYIDRNSMISSYPKCGFFMSSWGVENYRRQGKPIFEKVIDDCEPKFLITNSYQLSSAMNASSTEASPYAIFDLDASTLRANFIHHWGDIWVAGKSFSPGVLPIDFIITSGGIYTIESSAPAVIDGQQFKGGDYVFLAKGSHVINASEHEITLRFGRDLPRPDYAQTRPIYFGFIWDIINMLKL